MSNNGINGIDTKDMSEQIKAELGGIYEQASQ